MFQSRDEVRRVYANVWQKMQQGQLLEPMEALIAEVIEWHPEYHPTISLTWSCTARCTHRDSSTRMMSKHRRWKPLRPNCCAGSGSLTLTCLTDELISIVSRKT